MPVSRTHREIEAVWRIDRPAKARAEFERATTLTRNGRERGLPWDGPPPAPAHRG